MELRDKVVVITGASRGLGAELAKQLSTEGARVVIVARSSSDLDKLATKINAFPLVCDVTKESNLEKVANLVVEKFGRIDLWINNAGILFANKNAEDETSAHICATIEVNLLGTIWGSQTALRYMKKQKSGAIINIISTSGRIPRAGYAVYVASKWGASGFTKSIRLEAEPLGIKVFGIYPGGMKTNLFNDGKPESYDYFMDPVKVAEKIISNLKQTNPQEEQLIERGQ